MKMKPLLFICMSLKVPRVSMYLCSFLNLPTYLYHWWGPYQDEMGSHFHEQVQNELILFLPVHITYNLNFSSACSKVLLSSIGCPLTSPCLKSTSYFESAVEYILTICLESGNIIKNLEGWQAR